MTENGFLTVIHKEIVLRKLLILKRNNWTVSDSEDFFDFFLSQLDPHSGL